MRARRIPADAGWAKVAGLLNVAAAAGAHVSGVVSRRRLPAVLDVEWLAGSGRALACAYVGRQSAAIPSIMRNRAVDDALREVLGAIRVVIGLAVCDEPHGLGRIRAPSLVLWGESDGIVSPSYGRGFAERIPDAEFQTIAAAGHYPYLEQPEAFVKAVTQFLNR